MSLLSKLYEMSKSFHVVKAIIKYEKTKLVFETNSEKRTFSFSAKAASEGLTVKENGYLNELRFQVTGANEKIWKTTKMVRSSYKTAASVRILIDAKKSINQCKERLDVVLLTVFVSEPEIK